MQWQQWVEWPAAEKSLKFAEVMMVAGRTLWGVSERAYGQWPFVKPGRGARMVIASRTRKDVPPYEAPTEPGKRGQGRPRMYTTRWLDLKPPAPPSSGRARRSLLRLGKTDDHEL